MRLYNGCPDTELKELIMRRQKSHKKLNDMGMEAIYFPGGEDQGFIVFEKLKQVTGPHPDVISALEAVLYKRSICYESKQKHCRPIH